MFRKTTKQTKNKLNNRGISLVEILVAITILAIAAGALLHAFITSTKINMRAKEQQRVTTAAQSVMEGLKAYTLEDICWQFNNIAGHDFKIYSAVGSRKEVPSGDAAITGITPTLSIKQWDEGGVMQHEYEPDGDGKFLFVMQNISYEGQLYDAKVELEPMAGGQTIYYAREMDSTTDAVWKSPQGLDAAAQTVILQNVLDKLNEIDEFYEYEMTNLDTSKITIDKTTYITIGGTEGAYTASVKCEYAYKVVDYPYYDATGAEQTWNSEEMEPFTAITSLPDTTFYSGASLENVYLYYYPSYASSLSDVPVNSDTINITNSTSGAKTVFLVKQVPPGLDESGKIKLLTKENGYAPAVNGSGSITLYHNLNVNLADPSSSVGPYALSGFSDLHTDFLETENEYLLYRVKVFIYEPGAVAAAETAAWTFGDAIFELDGSINGK